MTASALRGIRGRTAIVTVAALALLLRLAAFVRRFAVDLLYLDQWDFLEPFFRGAFVLEAFRWQHGPHRQGLAALVYAVLLPATSWSGRAEAFVAVFSIAFACAVALVVKKVFAGPTILADIFIPLAFFGLSSYELFVGGQNLANGPLPLLLCMALAAALHIAKLSLRVFVLAAGAALSVYTGFALFLAPLTLVLLLLELRRAGDRTERGAVVLAIGLLVAASASFFVGYVWLPAVPCFRFPHFPLRDYVVFLSGISGRAWGVFYPNPTRLLALRIAFSVLLFLATAAAAVLGLLAAWRGASSNGSGRSGIGETTFLLCGFSVLFVLFTTVGRTCLGAMASLPSRYTIYSVPGMCGLYIGLRTYARAPAARRLVRALPLVLTLILVVKERRSGFDWDCGGWMGAKKAEWVQCYASTSDLAGCDSSTDFQIYPRESRKLAHIPEKLLFLRTHGLSLFAGPPPLFRDGRRVR